MDKECVETVRLLLEVAPLVFETPSLAMKGGTAINLFVRDMPRLSVDIDVVYTDHRASRPSALEFIATAMESARKRLAERGLDVEAAAASEHDEIKLFVRRGRSHVKVEVNPVFRGTVLPVEHRSIGPEARRVFACELAAPVLAAPELYGSKLVAALDRQHPRDLFDVQGMFDREGLAPDVVECFVCYLAGHNRPVHEVLFSRDRDIAQAFENEFLGMTRAPIRLDDLLVARRRLRMELLSALTSNHREFLAGLAAGAPDWRLMRCSHLGELPAIQWKLQNLARLKRSNPGKFAQQSEELRTRFGS